ncbi:hypothetical protein SAY86_022359 [Trapa natans]|uniref:Methyltransferase family protein n=1 Tax=Trapa natans TaxID=22666 RepID=A0AAN7LVK6_TRANT|nr:hypothetical protein SAY86_022359 [Trapa natans]
MARQCGGGEKEEEIVCLDESFFINDNYELTKFTFGSQILELYCLQSASTDFDLTGQLVWPGAMLLNEYLSKNVGLLKGCSVIELGSGVGITGILCSRFCREVWLTDNNNEVLKILEKNIELHHPSSDEHSCRAELVSEKLEWGNSDQINQILRRHPGGFDLILGADIYILISSNAEVAMINCMVKRSFICVFHFFLSAVDNIFDSVEEILNNQYAFNNRVSPCFLTQ